jgi:hypothetical protein
MRILTFLILLVLASCTTKPQIQTTSDKVTTITEINPNKWTAITRQNLEQLFQVYHLKPFLFTHDLQIESQVPPHSHPVLTLNTRFAEQPNKLLSVFIHEQLHWWARSKSESVDKAILELKVLFPNLPKDGLNLIICFLEYKSMIHLVGRKEANKILKDFIHKDKIYPNIYSQVYLKYKQIDDIVTKHALSPF